MKSKFFAGLVLFSGIACASAENMETLIKRHQKAPLSEFPTDNIEDFSSLHQAAVGGDIVAQAKIPSLSMAHLQSVYGILVAQDGLLFSVRRPARNYDKAKSNYAVNIAEFFETTTDDIRVKKSNFEVTAKDGSVYQITVLKYKPDGAMIEVKKNGLAQWLALADLSDGDRRFIENALADEIFESSGDFIVSSLDSRLGEVDSSERDKVSHQSGETGEMVVGSFATASMKAISRRIVLENKGPVPLENIVVEYQSFVEQKILGLSSDFPSDYRCVGFFEIKSLAPHEKKEIAVNLPETVDTKQESIHTVDHEYTRVFRPGLNPNSEGRMNGIWVRVHRFTPYGERLTREYKSAGVPSAEWNNVAPVSADIR